MDLLLTAWSLLLNTGVVRLRLRKKNTFATNRLGVRRLRKTTTGWHFCVKMSDGSTEWTTLAALKESNPVDVAENAVATGIDDKEPTFDGFGPFTFRQRDVCVAVMSKRRTSAQGNTQVWC